MLITVQAGTTIDGQLMWSPEDDSPELEQHLQAFPSRQLAGGMLPLYPFAATTGQCRTIELIQPLIHTDSKPPSRASRAPGPAPAAGGSR